MVAATGVARGAGVVVAGAGANRAGANSRPPQQNDFGGPVPDRGCITHSVCIWWVHTRRLLPVLGLLASQCLATCKISRFP